MTDPFQRIQSSVTPDTLRIIGLGNNDRADDGCGLEIAKRIKARFQQRAFMETDRPVENLVIDFLEDPNVHSILFIDATDFNGRPGEIRLFDAEDANRFSPGFSTHKVPISLLMGIIKQKGKHPFLLGIQPGSIQLMDKMTLEVQCSIQRIEFFFVFYLLPSPDKPENYCCIV